MRKSETVESTAQPVCAQCGSRLTLSGDGEKLCTHCLLQVALNQDDVDPDQALRRFDHSIPSDNGTPIEFGDYELLQEIGRGSQGVVYRARQKSLNRTVALKIIACGHWASQPHVKRFRREAEAAASLNHPGIVPIYEVGERDGACYFSMRFVEGGQLDAIASQEPMSLRRAAELIAKLARIVHYAHEHGILHRDIKPGNILLDATGEPHLSDFGLARLVETESTVTQTRDVMGTPSYMAPEQAVGDNAAISSATDVYGLGAVLYQLLTGHPPFAGGTSYETIKLLLDTEPRQPRLLKSENRSRSFHDLSEVSGERSKAPLLDRSRAGRRPRALAKARANSGAADRNFGARQKVGAAKSNYGDRSSVIGRPGRGRRHDHFEKRVVAPGARGRHCGAAV